MQSEELVSIVIPVYNGAEFIGRTLASALAQTYHNIEVIVVDDGSSDQTPAIVDAAATNDGRIRQYHRKNSGVALARNFGVEQARGGLIAPLDADDLWHPQKIARQVAAINASPNIGLVYCWSIMIDSDDVIILPVAEKQSLVTTNIVKEMASNGNFISCSSVPLIRRSYFKAIGGYDPNLHFLKAQGCEDWKLYLALSEICEFAVVPVHLVGYRRSTSSMSANIAMMERSMELVSEWLIERLPDMAESGKGEMLYVRYSYLANAALTANQFVKALNYMLKGYRARPDALKESLLRFGIRFGARVLGLKRSAIPLIWGNPIHFKDFKIRE